MNPLREHRETIDYLPNGKAVCYDHHFRRCEICCVDYTFDDDDDESLAADSDDPLDLGEDHRAISGVRVDMPDEKVFELWGPAARFVPQTDKQIIGHAPNARPAVAKPRFQFCTHCDLTWLVGLERVSAAGSHPSHHTLYHQITGTRRSLVVWLDGACPGNGSPYARAGVGVYFGPDSRYNISEALPTPRGGVATSQKAELTAAARTLRTVYRQVLPARKTECFAAPGSMSAVRDATKFRLVVVTDSSYLVECLCEHMPNWTVNAADVLVNKKGKVIANSKEFVEVVSGVKELAGVGVQVVWHHVRREENEHADLLAREML